MKPSQKLAACVLLAIASPCVAEDPAPQQRMLDSAKLAFEGITKKEMIVPFTPEFAALKILWSKRWRDAELALTTDKNQRIVAAKTHLERMAKSVERRLKAHVEIYPDVTLLELLQAVAEAEVVVARESN